jgi:hypothetical protein
MSICSQSKNGMDVDRDSRVCWYIRGYAGWDHLIHPSALVLRSFAFVVHSSALVVVDACARRRTCPADRYACVMWLSSNHRVRARVLRRQKGNGAAAAAPLGLNPLGSDAFSLPLLTIAL